jgi:hypothetical protein
MPPKQQGAARSTAWQVSQFVEDHEIELSQVFGNLPGLALGLSGSMAEKNTTGGLIADRSVNGATLDGSTC